MADAALRADRSAGSSPPKAGVKYTLLRGALYSVFEGEDVLYLTIRLNVSESHGVIRVPGSQQS